MRIVKSYPDNGKGGLGGGATEGLYPISERWWHVAPVGLPE